ncbi:MAG: hypothetical protein JST51_11995 [Armatimonadetes bacterium]|nr:hypothetical protein [Armatimonadota bacterium]
MNRGITLGLALASLSGAAMAQISISAGTYLPKDATIKNIFGSSSFAWGFGIGSANRAHRAGGGFDIAGLSLSATNNRFFTVGVTYGFEVQSGEGTEAMTYARIGSGIGYYDYNMNIGATNLRDQVFRQFTAAEAGVVLSKHVTVSAQYLLMPKLQGLDFSGLRLQAMYSFGN